MVLKLFVSSPIIFPEGTGVVMPSSASDGVGKSVASVTGAEDWGGWGAGPMFESNEAATCVGANDEAADIGWESSFRGRLTAGPLGVGVMSLTFRKGDSSPSSSLTVSAFMARLREVALVTRLPRPGVEDALVVGLPRAVAVF